MVKKKHKTTPPDMSIAEIRFAQKYAETGNSTKSYMDAGFTTQPASESAAHVRAWRVLRKPNVRNYIRKLQEDACESAKITIDELARSLREQAYADRTAIWKDGTMLPPHEWPRELRSLIAGVECDNIEEWIRDPDTGERSKIVVGQKWKVKFERSTEAKKILAIWKRMIGSDAEDGESGMAGESVLVIRLNKDDVPPPEVEDKR